MKIVITGGPSCGKTTLINELRKKGHFVMEEVARKIIIEKNYSKNLDSYDNEALDFQLDNFKKQIEKEKDLDKADEVYQHLVFLDRGIIDGRAYSKILLGYIPNELMNITVKRYDAVIILDRLPFIDDGLRRETEEEADLIHRGIIKEYIDAGYTPLSIPVMSIKERMRYLSNIIVKLESDKEGLENLKIIAET